MATKQSYILTVARANSVRFSTIFQEIKALLDQSGKFKKSSQAFGIAIEVYCQTMKNGGHPFKRLHRKDIWTWDLEALLAIKPEVSAENVKVHNKLYAGLKAAGKGRGAKDVSDRQHAKRIK